MGALMRAGGISFILGTLLLGVGGYASLRHASLAAVGGRVAEGNLVWVTFASRVGISLIMLGVLTASAVLFLLVRTMLAPRT